MPETEPAICEEASVPQRDLSVFTTPTRSGARCSIAIILEDLDPGKADDLRTVLEDPRVIYTKVEEHAPEVFGVEIRAATASRHARGQCSCG
jgi:hypothetical protein